MGKKASIIQDQSVIANEIQGSTESCGKAIFDINSFHPGDYYLEVDIGGQRLLRKAHLPSY